MPYREVPPIGVYFLAFESETGCLFSSLTLKQGAKFVRSLRARVPIQNSVWPPPVGFKYLSFVQEINPSFDVFNIFVVINGIQYKNLLRFPLKTTHFCVLIHCSADCWLFPQALPLPPKKIALKTTENSRKISITKEICITIDSPKRSLEESQTPRQGVYLKISLRNRVTL